MTTIGFLGGYSIDNAGDQLLGYATRLAFRQRLPRAEQVLLAPALRGDIWRHGWTAERGIDVPVRKIPADASTAWAKGLDAVVIGGGELIRLEPDFRPFLLGEASDWSPSIPAAWNSVGAEKTASYLPDQRPAYRAIKRCCETLAYVSVRNETTARFLRRCGFSGELHVVPDPTMILTPAPDPRADAILEEAGVDTTRFVLGLSVGNSIRDPRAAGFYKELFAALAELGDPKRGRTPSGRPVQVVLFPFGNAYGDPELQKIAVRALPGAVLLDAPLGPLERLGLIGALDAYVCTRYHAMITAFLQDVPFVVMDEYLCDATASSKIRDFVADNALEGAYLAPALSTQPRGKLARVIALAEDPEASFAGRRDALRRTLAAHYDAMLGALGLGQ